MRAAAFSALRAGLAPMAVDRFCDVDLADRCTARRSERYPLDLPSLARRFPSASWMYTGGMENRAALVDEIGKTRDLYGNSGSVLRKVRCPFLVVDALRSAGLPCLDVRKSCPSSRLEQWVRKPVTSCGGARVCLADDDAAMNEAGLSADSDVYYFQRFAPGVASSAVFVAAGGWSSLLGVTRQLIGESWTGATGFQYCGSVGPQHVSEQITQRFRNIGDCLAARFGLVGLLGVDAMIDDDNVWVVEVNPRYTASVEVIERVFGIRALSLHVEACRSGRLPASNEPSTGRMAGKAIIYALGHGLVPVEFGEMAARLNGDSRWPTLADIPAAGTELRPGQPVATVLAEGGDATDVEQRLKQLVQDVRRSLEWDDSPSR